MSNLKKLGTDIAGRRIFEGDKVIVIARDTELRDHKKTCRDGERGTVIGMSSLAKYDISIALDGKSCKFSAFCDEVLVLPETHVASPVCSSCGQPIGA